MKGLAIMLTKFRTRLFLRPKHIVWGPENEIKVRPTLCDLCERVILEITKPRYKRDSAACRVRQPFAFPRVFASAVTIFAHATSSIPLYFPHSSLQEPVDLGIPG